MNSREFFFEVAAMRQAQRDYFNNHDQMTLRACKAIEWKIDKEIARVKAKLIKNQQVEAACNAKCLKFCDGTCEYGYYDKERCERFRHINNINTIDI